MSPRRDNTYRSSRRPIWLWRQRQQLEATKTLYSSSAHSTINRRVFRPLSEQLFRIESARYQDRCEIYNQRNTLVSEVGSRILYRVSISIPRSNVKMRESNLRKSVMFITPCPSVLFPSRNDTTACWSNIIRRYLNENSPLLRPTIDCINAFGASSHDKYTGRR